MKKPQKWEPMHNVYIAFDEWGMPIGYLRPIRMSLDARKGTLQPQ